jgi:4,5:9,10-diseco-3-hydroxy-5,9,17-trioxoandrosta-1(10),2-diene-4-oate hydrolase
MLTSIILDNAKLVYECTGDPKNPPLILLHGWMSHRGVWDSTVAILKERYYCVQIDLLGFGASDKPDTGDYSIAAQGRRVLALADALGFGRFTLMGHSMGGQISLCIAALLTPERLEKLVNVDGVVTGRLAPSIQNTTYRFAAVGKVFPQVYSLWRFLLQSDWAVRETFKDWFYRMDCMPRAQWAIDRDLAFRPEMHISVYQAGQAIRTDLTPHLAKITTPTLTIFGRQDAVVPVGDGELAAQRIPAARLVWIDACGHFPMYEQPGPYFEAISSFLA